MPDYMDQLVDAQTANDEADLKALAAQGGLSDEDKALLDEGAMTVEAAKQVTEAIKNYATATWILVKRAHDGKAWKSLGYSTWADYVRTEFDMSASRSYQLINQSQVIATLEEAAPEGTRLLLTEAQTRDIRNELPRITEKVKAATAGDSPSVAASKINDIVEQERASIKNDSGTVEEDSFQYLDPKGSAPKQDRLNAKDSGSTADDSLDLDADIDESPEPSGGSQSLKSDDGLGDDDLYDDGGNDSDGDMDDYVADLMYVFQFFDKLSSETNPQELAGGYTDDLDELKKKTSQIIKWFTDLSKVIG